MKKNFLLGIFVCLLLLTGCDKTSISFDDNSSVENIGEITVESGIVAESENLSIFPSWVVDLGIDEPENMELDESNFKIVTESDGGYDYFFARYLGDYDTALDQGDRIAGNIGGMYYSYLSNFQDQDISQEYKDFFGDVDGAMYTNYTLTTDPISKYMVTISVETSGILDIEVVDWEKSILN